MANLLSVKVYETNQKPNQFMVHWYDDYEEGVAWIDKTSDQKEELISVLDNVPICFLSHVTRVSDTEITADWLEFSGIEVCLVNGDGYYMFEPEDMY